MSPASLLVAAAVTAASASGSPRAGVRSCAIEALEPIRVGIQPGPIVITPSGKTAYVANARSGTVTPIRIATNTALRPIWAGSTPFAMAISPDGKMLYVVDYADRGMVVPIRTATARPLRPIRVGHFPGAIAITPDGKTAYVLNTNISRNRDSCRGCMQVRAVSLVGPDRDRLGRDRPGCVRHQHELRHGDADRDVRQPAWAADQGRQPAGRDCHHAQREVGVCL